MVTTILICVTVIICVWIICEFRYEKTKPPKQLTVMDTCPHDMRPPIVMFEDDDYKNMTSTCSKCGYEREYEFNKNGN